MEKHIKEQELWEIYIRVQWDTETEAPDLRRGQYRGPAVLQRWQHGIVLPRAEFWITGVCQELGAVEESSRQIEYMDSNGGQVPQEFCTESQLLPEPANSRGPVGYLALTHFSSHAWPGTPTNTCPLVSTHYLSFTYTPESPEHNSQMETTC